MTQDTSAPAAATAPQTPARGSKNPPVRGGATRTARYAGLPRIPWWPALLAAVLTCATAFWGLTGPQMWFDEAATISAVTRPFGSLLRLLQDVDAVHGLYYLLMYPWVALFGTSELAMRAPSAIALTLAAPLLARLAMACARRHVPERMVLTGVAVAVLFALFPGITWSGQDARGYAMAVLATVAALWCFERFCDHRGTWPLIGFALCQAAAIGFSMYAAIVVVLYLVRALTWGRAAFLRVLVASAVTGVLCLPLILLAASQSGQVSWIDLSLPQVLERMALRTFFVSPVNRGGEMGALSLDIAPWLGLLVLVVLALGLLRGPGRRHLLWLICYVALPLLIVIAAQLAGEQFFQERYFTFSAPVLVLALSLALAAIRWRPVIVVLTAAIAALSVPSLLGQNTDDAKSGDNYRTASQIVNQTDTVIFMERSDRGIFNAYPPDHEIADPMLAEDRISADNLWGLSEPGYTAWQIDTVGPTSVVSNKNNGYHDAVLSHLGKNGCTVTQTSMETRFRITVLDCPDPASP